MPARSSPSPCARRTAASPRASSTSVALRPGANLALTAATARRSAVAGPKGVWAVARTGVTIPIVKALLTHYGLAAATARTVDEGLAPAIVLLAGARGLDPRAAGVLVA